MWESDRIWRCDCGDSHYLSIKVLDEEHRYLTIDGDFGAPRFRDRLKGLWQLLRHGHYDTWLSVVLTPETAAEIRDELTRLLEG